MTLTLSQHRPMQRRVECRGGGMGTEIMKGQGGGGAGSREVGMVEEREEGMVD